MVVKRATATENKRKKKVHRNRKLSSLPKLLISCNSAAVQHIRIWGEYWILTPLRLLNRPRRWISSAFCATFDRSFDWIRIRLDSIRAEYTNPRIERCLRRRLFENQIFLVQYSSVCGIRMEWPNSNQRRRYRALTHREHSFKASEAANVSWHFSLVLILFWFCNALFVWFFTRRIIIFHQFLQQERGHGRRYPFACMHAGLNEHARFRCVLLSLLAPAAILFCRMRIVFTKWHLHHCQRSSLVRPSDMN